MGSVTLLPIPSRDASPARRRTRTALVSALVLCGAVGLTACGKTISVTIESAAPYDSAKAATERKS